MIFKVPSNPNCSMTLWSNLFQQKHSVDKMTQHLVQPTFKVSNVGESTTFFGEIIPMADCAKISNCVQLESRQEKLVPTTSCLFHVTPCKEGVTISFVATL